MRFVTILLGLALGIGLSFVYAMLHPAIALASTVTGIITNGQGHPVANIRVSAWQNWGGSPPMWFEEAWALTDASGAYTLTGMSLLTDPTGAAFIERVSFADMVTPPRYASEYYTHSATRAINKLETQPETQGYR